MSVSCRLPVASLQRDRSQITSLESKAKIMKIRVQLFGRLRDEAAVPCLEFELPDLASVADLRACVAEKFTESAWILEYTSVAVNAEYATPDQILDESDEVALIPPVSGG